DPRNAHSRNAAILDGDLDMDGDALTNKREQAAHTNPFVADTDGDGWNDEAEFTAGSDPLDPLSRPSMLLRSAPPLKIGVGQFTLAGSSGGIFVARPV